MIAVFVLEREQVRLKESIAGARASTRRALEDREGHEGCTGKHRGSSRGRGEHETSEPKPAAS